MYCVLRAGLVVGFVMLLAACGGGGDGDGEVLQGKQTTYAVSGTLSLENVPAGATPPSVRLVDALTCPSSTPPANCSGVTLTALGGFTFASMAAGTSYQLDVRPQPAGYSCRVQNGNSRVESAAVNNIAVICAAGQFSIRATVTGLGNANPGLQVSNNSDVQSINDDGPFTFSVANRSSYSVRISRPHDHYRCTLRNPAGTDVTASAVTGMIDAADVSGITIACAAPIRATVAGLAGGTAGLTLTSTYDNGNGAQSAESIIVNANAAYEFNQRLPYGRAYTVTAVTSPSSDYTCSVVNGGGSVGVATINVTVTCTERTYSIGGVVTGLGAQSAGLVIRREAVAGRASEDRQIPATSPHNFTFPSALPNGSVVTLTEISEPDDRVCAFANGANTTVVTINRASIDNIAMTCSTPAPLTVLSTTPAGNLTNVPLGAQPQLNFSAALSASTVNGASVVLSAASGAHPVDGLTVSGSTITVRPRGKLMPTTLYTLTVTTGVRGAGKERLGVNFTTAFTTGTGWTAQQDSIPIAAASAGTSHIKFDADGRALMLWAEHNVYQGEFLSESDTSLRYSRCEFTGSLCAWTAPEQLLYDPPSLFGSAFQVTSIANSDALVTLYTASGPSLERRYSMGGWGASAIIAGSSANIFSGAAVDANTLGQAWLAYGSYDPNSNISISRYTPGASVWSSGSWSAPVAYFGGSGGMGLPSISMNSGGAAMLSFVRTVNALSSVMASAYGSDWAAPIPINDPAHGDAVSDSQLKVDSMGNGVAVWMQGSNSDYSVYSRRFTANGGWAPTIVPVENASTGAAHHLQLAMDVNGVATAVWAQYEGSVHGVFAARLINGSWDAPRKLNQIGSNASEPKLAVGADGSLLVVWTQLEGNGFSLYANRFTAATSQWSTATRIDSGSGSVSVPSIAIRNDGAGLAVWAKNQRLYASRFE